ncbi:MAG: helix-turn-helix domain-containing protein [Prolixibacteraceae bacterium]
MKDRIVKFIESQQLSAAEFADQIGVQRSSVSHVLNGRNNPSFSFIQKMLEVYPALNSRWLLTGKGDLFERVEQKPLAKIQEPKLFSTDQIENQLSTKSEVTQPSKPLLISDNDVKRPEIPQSTIENNIEKTVSRVLIFYTDHTFEDFRPAK